MPSEKELQGLLDKQAIREVLNRYCRGVDRADWELLASVYHPGAVDNHGPVQGPVESFIEWSKQFVGSLTACSHNITNCDIDLKDDHHAFCESYMIGYHAFDEEGVPTELIVGDRFMDHFEKRDNAWKIIHRTVVFDWYCKQPTSASWSGAMIDHFLPRGRIGRDDPYYSHREKIPD